MGEELGRSGSGAGRAETLGALAEEAQARVEAFSRAEPGTVAELFLLASRRLTLEHEASTGTSTLSQGTALTAAARVWRGGRWGFATSGLEGPEGLARVLATAEARLADGAPAPPPPLPAREGPPRPGLAELSGERARERAVWLVQALPSGRVLQAVLLTQSATWSGLARTGRPWVEGGSGSEEAFVRCETSRGAVVDALTAPLGEAWELEPLRSRFVQGLEALEGPAREANPRLPVVLRPAVAAPLVEGLAWVLRGDVVASSPALVRALGKKLFPSVLEVRDSPRHPLAPRCPALDDEGVPVQDARLIEEGRLRGFLHSVETASRLGGEPNGRGWRVEGAPPAPGPLHLFVSPRGDALPEHYTELVARVETFTTMPRPGTVCVRAGGWEVEGGRRVHRVLPVDLSLPVLDTFRALRGVGDDLTFFPTAAGCGTPSLLFAPLF